MEAEMQSEGKLNLGKKVEAKGKENKINMEPSQVGHTVWLWIVILFASFFSSNSWHKFIERNQTKRFPFVPIVLLIFPHCCQKVSSWEKSKRRPEGNGSNSRSSRGGVSSQCEAYFFWKNKKKKK